MTLDEFRRTLNQSRPPDSLPPLLRALWHDAKGDWDEAHRIAQDVNDEMGALVHAYLHRREGDRSNAAYWYLRAGRPIEHGALDEEWTAIVQELLPS